MVPFPTALGWVYASAVEGLLLTRRSGSREMTLTRSSRGRRGTLCAAELTATSIASADAIPTDGDFVYPRAQHYLARFRAPEVGTEKELQPPPQLLVTFLPGPVQSARKRSYSPPTAASDLPSGPRAVGTEKELQPPTAASDLPSVDKGPEPRSGVFTVLDQADGFHQRLTTASVRSDRRTLETMLIPKALTRQHHPERYLNDHHHHRRTSTSPLLPLLPFCMVPSPTALGWVYVSTVEGLLLTRRLARSPSQRRSARPGPRDDPLLP